MKNSIFLKTVYIALAVFSISACQRQDDSKTVGQKIDEGITDVRQATQQVENSAKAAVKEVDAKMAPVASDLKDSAISALVKAEFAKDSGLSSLQIQVETSHGKVTLSGKAPDEMSKMRASTLAKNVQGVKEVDNQIMASS